MSSTVIESLENFARAKGFSGKGPLSVALVVTDHARRNGLPLSADSLVTGGKGQVLGLGKAKVQSILAGHGIKRVLSEEGGRTSRGSMGNMQDYVACLNALFADSPDLDLALVEAFWVDKVRAFFLGKPFSLSLDSASSIRTFVKRLLDQAEARQKASAGMMYVGTVMQHLVGAKLELVLGEAMVRHESASASDQSTSRGGDFNVGDVAIHVTAAPSEALLRKCQSNLEKGLRPLIVTTVKGATLGRISAENAGLHERIDIFEIDQWIASNVMEWARFEAGARRLKIDELVTRYNLIVDKVENDPSLRIEDATRR